MAKRYAANYRELAKAIGVAPSALTYYKNRGAPIKKIEGKGYDIAALLEWTIEHGFAEGEEKEREREKAISGSKELRDELLKEQIKQTQLKNQRTELLMEIERGEFIPIEEMKNRDIARIQAVKRGLYSMVKSAAPLLIGLQGAREAEIVLQKQVQVLLERFSNM